MRVNKQLWVLCGIGGLLFSACSQDEKSTPAHFSVNTPEVSLTKKGVDRNNRNFILSVTSDTYWVAIPDTENAPWLRLSVRAGAAGETDIELSADENLAEESRETFIRFETETAVVQTVRVREEGASEMSVFLYDGFGAEQVSGIPIAEHVRTAEGFSAEDMAYAGTDCFIGSAPGSSGYDGASAGNHVILQGANAELRITDLQTFGNTEFLLTFGVRADQKFDSRQLVLSIRRDDGEWMLVPYLLSAGWTEGWNKVEVNLLLTEPCTSLALRFHAANNENYRIDDILLQETVLGPDDFYYTEGDLEHFNSEEWKWDDPSKGADSDETEDFGQEDYDWK